MGQALQPIELTWIVPLRIWIWNNLCVFILSWVWYRQTLIWLKQDANLFSSSEAWNRREEAGGGVYSEETCPPFQQHPNSVFSFPPCVALRIWKQHWKRWAVRILGKGQVHQAQDHGVTGTVPQIFKVYPKEDHEEEIKMCVWATTRFSTWVNLGFQFPGLMDVRWVPYLWTKTLTPMPGTWFLSLWFTKAWMIGFHVDSVPIPDPPPEFCLFSLWSQGPLSGPSPAVAPIVCGKFNSVDQFSGYNELDHLSCPYYISVLATYNRDYSLPVPLLLSDLWTYDSPMAGIFEH